MRNLCQTVRRISCEILGEERVKASLTTVQVANPKVRYMANITAKAGQQPRTEDLRKTAYVSVLGFLITSTNPGTSTRGKSFHPSPEVGSWGNILIGIFRCISSSGALVISSKLPFTSLKIISVLSY